MVEKNSLMPLRDGCPIIKGVWCISAGYAPQCRKSLNPIKKKLTGGGDAKIIMGHGPSVRVTYREVIATIQCERISCGDRRRAGRGSRGWFRKAKNKSRLFT